MTHPDNMDGLETWAQVCDNAFLYRSCEAMCYSTGLTFKDSSASVPAQHGKVGCLQWRSDFQQGFEAYCRFQLSRVLEIFPRVQLFAFNTKGVKIVATCDGSSSCSFVVEIRAEHGF